MLESIIFFLVMLFVIIPLYKSIRKMKASRVLNEELGRLALLYQYGLDSYNFAFAQDCLEQAKKAVQEFNADIHISPQDMAQFAPHIRRFPNWHTWL